MVVIRAFIWSQYLAIIIEYMYKNWVSVSYVALCCCWVKKKSVLYYRIHIEFACSEAFLSLPSSCTLIFSLELFFLSMMDAKCALFYFSIVFNNCFHMITQDIQLSTLILYLFYYNLLRYHSCDYWIKLYCIKYKLSTYTLVKCLCVFNDILHGFQLKWFPFPNQEFGDWRLFSWSYYLVKDLKVHYVRTGHLAILSSY